MVEIFSTADTVTANLSGDLDHHSAKTMRCDIDKEITSKHPKMLVIDFKNVTFMDSSGIGLIMGRYKLMQDMGGKVVVARPPAYIKKVLRLSGIDRLAEVTDDLPQTPQGKEETENEKAAAHSN